MEIISRRRAIGFIAGSVFGAFAGAAVAEESPPQQPAFAPFDLEFKDYGELLRRYVNPHMNAVNYCGLRKTGQGALNDFIERIGAVDHATFSAWDRSDQLAFLINAYNAITIQRILPHYREMSLRQASGLPVDQISIRDIPGVWNKIKTRVAGEEMTLDHLEHQIIRKVYNEPRIHMALVCAAVSCPRLRNEAYRGRELERQFEEQSGEFAKHRNEIDPENRRVTLSAILDWYKQDFASYRPEAPALLGGPHDKHAGSVGYLVRYADPAHRAFLRSGEYEIKIGEYDWTLNYVEYGRDDGCH